MTSPARSLLVYGAVLVTLFFGCGVGGYVYQHEPARDTLAVSVGPAAPACGPETVSGTVASIDGTRLVISTETGPVTIKLPPDAHIDDLVHATDGLAAGKGVVVAQSREEALDAVSRLMEDGAVGEAGKQVVIEECLQGTEVSILAFTDGTAIVPMVPACDYKRVFDDDQGPNTGGMGCYSPPGFVPRDLQERIAVEVLKPTVRAMAREGRPYRGVLYAGLMITDDGPKVIEFNCRFGDPETQAILPRLKSDLVEIAMATAEGNLDKVKVEWDQGASCGVVLASGGYPGSFTRGHEITGLDDVDPGILVFHAGTKAQGGRIVTLGGRVLTVVAVGDTLAEARDRVYANVERVRFTGRYFRRDIAAREV